MSERLQFDRAGVMDLARELLEHEKVLSGVVGEGDFRRYVVSGLEYWPGSKPNTDPVVILPGDLDPITTDVMDAAGTRFVDPEERATVYRASFAPAAGHLSMWGSVKVVAVSASSKSTLRTSPVPDMFQASWALDADDRIPRTEKEVEEEILAGYYMSKVLRQGRLVRARFFGGSSRRQQQIFGQVAEDLRALMQDTDASS